MKTFTILFSLLITSLVYAQPSLEPINATTVQVELGEADNTSLVKIGGDSPVDFVPGVNTSKWHDEVFVSLTYRAAAVLSWNGLITNAEISITSPQITFKAYPLNDNVLEIELHFNSQPTSIEFDVSHSPGLIWEYQPKLTPQEITDGYSRPENVVGSYAIYHTKRDNEYKTGKVLQAYSWKLTDDMGDSSLAVLEYVPVTLATGILKVKANEVWLAAADYPVVAMGNGDTFGYTTLGASQLKIENWIQGGVASPAADGTASMITMGAVETSSSNEHDSKCALYDDSDDSYIATSVELIEQYTTTPGWQDHTITGGQAVFAATTYKIAGWAGGGPGQLDIMYDSGSGTSFHDSVSYGAWPDPLTPADQSNRMSIYVTYEPTGNGDVLVPASGPARDMQGVGWGIGWGIFGYLQQK